MAIVPPAMGGPLAVPAIPAIPTGPLNGVNCMQPPSDSSTNLILTLWYYLSESTVANGLAEDAEACYGGGEERECIGENNDYPYLP